MQWYLSINDYPICYQLGKMQPHRFILTYILGECPPFQLYVNHIDRNKLNNTDANLRLVNSFNRTTKSNQR